MTLQEILDMILGFISQLIELLNAIPDGFWEWLGSIEWDD